MKTGTPTADQLQLFQRQDSRWVNDLWLKVGKETRTEVVATLATMARSAFDRRKQKTEAGHES